MPANGSLDVTIPVPVGDTLTVSLFSTTGASSALFDPSNVQQATLPAPSLPLPQAYNAADPAVGNWRLNLVNAKSSPVDVEVGASIEGNPFAVDLNIGTPDVERRATITATVTNGGAPVTDATVEGSVSPPDGTNMTDLLFTSNGDGTYTARSAKLAGGTSAVGVKALVGAQGRAASGWVSLPRVFKLALSRKGPGSASAAEGKGPFSEGSAVTLTATPQAGHTFTNWLVDGSVRTENPLTLQMNDDRVAVARFDFKSASTTSLDIVRPGSNVDISGTVAPDHEGMTVQAKLYVKKGTRFKRIGQATLTLDQASSYAASLPAPTKGKCKVTVKFAGSDTHAGSKVSRTFPCAAP
ncbi:MAG: hypothetical protein WD826_01240 [Actinomycetota bacterium]